MNKKGFTLIELLIVVAIIGILAAVGAVVIPNVLGNAKSTCAEDNHKKMVSYTKTVLTMCSIMFLTMCLTMCMTMCLTTCLL